MKQFFSSLFIAILLFSSAFGQNGLHFDGTNDQVQTTFAGVFGTSSRTFEAWIKTDAASPTNMCILDYGKNQVGSRNTFKTGNNGTLQFIAGGTNTNITSNSGVISSGQWMHVAFVLNNGTGYFYVNGVAAGTGNLSNVNTPTGGTNMRIGQRVPGGSIRFEGAIDEVRIWNVARTQTEIQNSMNSEFCTIPSSLVAYYKFNHGVAGGSNNGVTTLTDFSGNGANGTLSSFSLSGNTSNWVTGANLTSGSVTGGTSQVTSCVPYTSAGGQVLNATASIQDTVTSASGCDSIYTLNFTALASTTSSLVVTECSFYTSPAGDVYFNSAIFNDTLQNAAGCDSIITIDLTVNNPSFSTVSPVVCSVYVSPAGQIITQSGTYADTLQNSSGCDSLFVMNVTVVGTFQRTVTDTACATYTLPGGSTISSSGTYIDTLQSSQGCDSVITSNITINDAYQITDVVNVCGAYTSPNGTVYPASGSYTENYTSTAGCDSVVTLELTVDALDATVSQNDFTLTAMSGYDSYQWIDCNDNDAPIAGETTDTYTAEQSGNYAVVLMNGTCSDTSACTEVTGVGYEEVKGSEITFWPNPAESSILHIVGSTIEVREVRLISMSGVVYTLALNQGQVDLSQVANGVYVVAIPNKGKLSSKLVVLK